MSKTSLLKSFLICVPAVFVTAIGDAANRQIYHDYARVLNVSPIMETFQMPVKREDCQTRARVRRDLQSITDLSGDVRTIHPELTLAQAIRQDRAYQLSLITPQTNRVCRWVEAFETRERIVAYRVRFRYGKDTFVRRLDHDPGERLRIRVELRPID